VDIPCGKETAIHILNSTKSAGLRRNFLSALLSTCWPAKTTEQTAYKMSSLHAIGAIKEGIAENWRQALLIIGKWCNKGCARVDGFAGQLQCTFESAHIYLLG
jgi:hypothetical protein